MTPAVTSAPPRRRLSALVVNYNTGTFAEVAIASLRCEWIAEGRHPDDLEVILVDNASPRDQTEPLERMERHGVRVLRSDSNLGYAGGMNLAYSHSTGDSADVVAVLNPDLYFLPGSLSKLFDFVADNPDIGAADPRTYFDPGKVLHLPRNLLPTLWEHVFITGSLRFKSILRWYTKKRTRLAAQWWTATDVVDSDMLSGCCVFLRREVIDRLGMLMDDRFPLYYEDTDLFRRVRRLGLRVVHQVHAEVLHHWSRSSGIGAAFEGEPRKRQLAAARVYYAKYYGPIGGKIADWITAKGQIWGSRGGVPLHDCIELGPLADPPRIAWDRERDVILEVGLLSNWLLSAGIVVHGDAWVCPLESWEWFFEGAYFVRALDQKTGAMLGAWSFTKCTPGRNHPLPAPLPPTRAVEGAVEGAAR